MIFETLQTAAENPLVRQSHLVRRALDWAAGVGPDAAPGRFEIEGEDLYAMIQHRKPSPIENLREAEAHRKYVDLQYCISGGEIIDWFALPGLKETKPYNEAADFVLYDISQIEPLPLVMRPGRFALLLPQDAHVPALHDGRHEMCVMVVFKLRLDRLVLP